VEIISSSPNREISLVLCMLDSTLEKLCLKHKQQIGKLLDSWKKNHIITETVKLSLPQNSPLLYPVQWLMKNWYISFIIDLIFLRLP